MQPGPDLPADELQGEKREMSQVNNMYLFVS